MNLNLKKSPIALALLAAASALPSVAEAAPTVSWSAPSSGATMYGAYSNSTACQVSASGANRVKFYVDSEEVTTDKTAPYQCAFDTRKYKTGTHTLRAIAIASDGSTSTATRSVNFGTSSSSVTPPPTTEPTTPPPTTTPTTGTSTPPPTSGSLDIWFKSPRSGNTVSGVLSGTSCYVAGSGIARVDFSVDGTALNADTNMADGMQCVLDTTKLANGTHTLTARATSSTGATRSDVISINVQNAATTPPPPANTAPAVSFTSPAAGTVSGTVSYAAIASDDKAVTRVVFKLDGATIADKTAAPWSGSINTTTLSNAAHTLTATAYDAEGLNTTATVALNVSNTVTQPTTPPTSGTSTPPPTSGALDIWFKAPRSGNTVSGVLSGTSCYTAGSGIARVDFSVDGTALNADTTMADGMQCVLDTTKLSNGTHTLTAKATSSTGATRSDVISINVQNGSSTPPPSGGDSGGSNDGGTTTPPPPTAGGLPSDSTGVKGIATFESIGLYWSNPGASSATGCKVQFRKQGETAWKDGLDLWFDSRNSECRGSLVHLTPGTNYEVQMGLPGQSFRKGLVVATWSEQYPIARTVTLSPGSSQINITQGGTKDGYVLYTAAPGTVLDVNNGADFNINVSAPYVIIRGLTLKGARIDAVRISPGARDVVVERNEITNWGRTRGSNLGVDQDSGVRAICNSSWRTERIVVQNNKFHNPRYGANSWSSGHPAGPQAITIHECNGNNVFRYNDIYSSTGKYYNDAIGAGENFSSIGSPSFDSDIYGNRITHTYDDAIEAEGANRNVRIWGNYMDGTFVGVASTVTHTGPLYVFRNVYNNGQTFGKSGQKSGYGGGRRYFFHNLTLGGADAGIKGNTNEPMTNSWSRNNVWHMNSSGGTAIGVIGGTENNFDYDMSNGNMRPYTGAEAHGIVGTPTYASGHGTGSGGNYQLAPGSRGFDQGVRIPNFNDAFIGAAPDMGPHEGGTPAMKLGVQ